MPIPKVSVDEQSPAPDSDEEPEIIPKIGGLGIFEPEMSSTKSPLSNAGLDLSDDTENVQDLNGEVLMPISDNVNKASTEDNNGTYILLALLAIGLIVLIVFVAMKNRKSKKKNSHGIETGPATELLDMDKKLLGKPKEQNGNGNGNAQFEHIPLIDREKANGGSNGANGDHKPNIYTTFHPPPILVDEHVKDPEKSQHSLYENVPKVNGNHHDDDTFFAAESDTEPNNNNDLNALGVSPAPAKRYSPIYTPASPRSDRYSPVYS